MGSRVCDELGPMLLDSGKKLEKKSLEKRGPVACLLCWPRLRPFSAALSIDSLSFSYTAKGRSHADSSREFLRIENELIKTAQINSYG